MSFEEIRGVAAVAGRVVKAITVLGNGPSVEDSCLSVHTFGDLFYKPCSRLFKTPADDV
jgi:hypothetical protein